MATNLEIRNQLATKYGSVDNFFNSDDFKKFDTDKQSKLKTALGILDSGGTVDYTAPNSKKYTGTKDLTTGKITIPGRTGDLTFDNTDAMKAKIDKENPVGTTPDFSFGENNKKSEQDNTKLTDNIKGNTTEIASATDSNTKAVGDLADYQTNRFNYLLNNFSNYKNEVQSGYDKISDDTKAKYSTLFNDLAAQQSKMEESLNKIQGMTDEYYKVAQQNLSNKIAGNKAGLTATLGNAGATDTIINNAMAATDNNYAGEKEALVKNYVENMTNTAKTYNELATSLLNNKTNLSKEERDFALNLQEKANALMKDEKEIKADAYDAINKGLYDKLSKNLETETTAGQDLVKTKAAIEGYNKSDAATKKSLLLSSLGLDKVDAQTAAYIKTPELQKVLDEAAAGPSMAWALAHLREYVSQATTGTSTSSSSAASRIGAAANKAITNLNKNYGTSSSKSTSSQQPAKSTQSSTNATDTNTKAEQMRKDFETNKTKAGTVTYADGSKIQFDGKGRYNYYTAAGKQSGWKQIGNISTASTPTPAPTTTTPTPTAVKSISVTNDDDKIALARAKFFNENKDKAGTVTFKDGSKIEYNGQGQYNYTDKSGKTYGLQNIGDKITSKPYYTNITPTASSNWYDSHPYQSGQVKYSDGSIKYFDGQGNYTFVDANGKNYGKKKIGTQ